jgi:hypothetical protein
MRDQPVRRLAVGEAWGRLLRHPGESRHAPLPPPRSVGLADRAAAHAAHVDGNEVERRNFLAGAVAVATVPALAGLLSAPQRASADGGQAATLRLAATAFRRMDDTTPSRHLTEPVLAHLRLVQTIAGETDGKEQRARLSAVGSEVASLAGWLSFGARSRRSDRGRRTSCGIPWQPAGGTSRSLLDELFRCDQWS